jgi:hypothetical protein
VADGLGDVPVATKVSAFEREVSGDEEVVIGGWGKYGAVIADAQLEGFGFEGGGAGADAVD